MFWKKKKEEKKMFEVPEGNRGAYRVYPSADSPILVKIKGGKTSKAVDICAGGISFPNDSYEVGSTHDCKIKLSRDVEPFAAKVIIHKIVDGVFFSSLICVRDKIEEIIDSRTSDAIALAIRFNSPIFTYENVLDKAGIILKAGEIKRDKEEKKSEEDDLSKKIDYGKLSIIQLEKAISIAVKNEDYELAAYLRDEINKRK